MAQKLSLNKKGGKLLFLVSSMEGGGAERVAAILASAWSERGWEVTLMPTFSGRGGVSYSVSSAVRLHFLADDVDNRKGKLRRLLALRRHIRKTQPDLIVSFLPHVNIAALLAAYGSGIPVVACERIYPPLLQPQIPVLYRAIRQKFYPRAALLIGQTEGVRVWLQRHFAPTPIASIPNPVQYPLPAKPPTLNPRDIAREPRQLLLAVGRLHTQKRFDLLIAAFAQLAPENPGWDLIILGEGAERKALTQQVAAAGLESRVLLPGFAGNMSDWYKRADIYVMTSAYEGFPNTLLEAMAYGLPSVVFDVKTGPKEIMDNGRRGVLLPDDDHVGRLACALDELISDPVRRQNLANLACEVREEFALPRILDMWDEAFAAILEQTDER